MVRLFQNSWVRLPFLVWISLLLLLVFGFQLQQQDILKYGKSSTIKIDHYVDQSEIQSLVDSITGDSLLLLISKEGVPLWYSKEVSKEICFDGKCRRLVISIFWNITGRYLGFELTDGEFLSKYDHKPFTASAYEQLNDLLANPDLPFDEIAFERIVELPEAVSDSVDAVSGATAQDLSDLVVEGAAYTTYALWNIVYGSNQDCVETSTEDRLTSELLQLILESADITDRLWALKRIDANVELDDQLRATLLKYVAGTDFYLSHMALRTIESAHLRDQSLQDDLFAIYEQAEHSLQKMIIEKLKQAPYLSAQVVEVSQKILLNLNGAQLRDMLSLYAEHKVNDLDLYRRVAGILKNSNRYIAKQAHAFLMAASIADDEVNVMLEDYERNIRNQ